LSVNADGINYELAPGRSNLCRAIGILLFGKDIQLVNLQDLEVAWNNHLFSLKGDLSLNKPFISCKDTMMIFRAPLSDTEKIIRETGSLDFPHLNVKLLVELERAHNLASVKYVKLNPSKRVWSDPVVVNIAVQEWKNTLTRNFNEQTLSTVFSIHITKLFLLLAVLEDNSLETLDLNTQGKYISLYELHLLCYAAMCCSWGEERLNHSHLSLSQINQNQGQDFVSGNLSSLAAEIKRLHDNNMVLKLLLLLRKVVQTDATNLELFFIWVIREIPDSLSAFRISSVLFPIHAELTKSSKLREFMSSALNSQISSNVFKSWFILTHQIPESVHNSLSVWNRVMIYVSRQLLQLKNSWFN
jgi:hypothetical protein